MFCKYILDRYKMDLDCCRKAKLRPYLQVIIYCSSVLHTHAHVLALFSRVPYTLSVKLSDFTVWCHTWRKTWVNCAVLTGNSAGLRTVLSSPLSQRELRSSLRESHSFLCLRWHHLKAHPFLAINSADEHRMIYSFSNTTSYLTFYAFFSSFRITLWPMWLANDNLVFIHYSHTYKKAHRSDKKLTNLMGNLCCSRENSVFCVVFLHS
jgi:hypothetical protein